MFCFSYIEIVFIGLAKKGILDDLNKETGQIIILKRRSMSRKILPSGKSAPNVISFAAE
jgi:hypothetical protein